MSYYSDIVLEDHPIAFWPLNETSGRVANDISGNEHNGNYAGFGFAQGQPGIYAIGPSLKFVDKTSYIIVPNFTIVAPVTFEFWFFIAGSNVTNSILSKFDQNTLIGFSFSSVNSGQIATRFPPGYFTYSHNQYPGNVWHYMIIALDSNSTLTFFIDGTIAESYFDRFGALILPPIIITGSISNSENLLIGSDGLATNFKGNLMNIAIYDYLLPQERIIIHANPPTIKYNRKQVNLTGNIYG